MEFPLKNTRVLLGVCGGIAAYKAAELCREFQRAGVTVRAILTRSAREFVTPLTFETLTGHPVYTGMFDKSRAFEIEHISFARWGQVLVIAPATANMLAKMAAGLADDPLSTTVLAFQGPVVVAPAMNTAMWSHPKTRENLDILRARGIHIVEPGAGTLACGEEGAGRLAELPLILEAASAAFETALETARGGDGPLRGKRVLITAGPTVEMIDPVRFLSNPSSGRMGFALAADAAKRGARVTLITGPVSIEAPAGLEEIARVRSAAEMRDAVLERLPLQDICVFSAAVADFTPVEPLPGKIKKEDLGNETTLRLKRAPDIAAEANAARRPGQFHVGFAAETDDLERHAREKMERKGFDVVAANLVSARNPAFGARENEMTFFSRDGARFDPPRADKEKLAEALWDFIITKLKSA